MAGDRSGGAMPQYMTAAGKAIAAKAATLAALKAEIAATPAPTMAQIGRLASLSRPATELGDNARGLAVTQRNQNNKVAADARALLDLTIPKAQAAGTLQLPQNYTGEMKWSGLTDPTSVAKWTPDQKALQQLDPTIFESVWKQTATPAELQRLNQVDAIVTKQRAGGGGLFSVLDPIAQVASFVPGPWQIPARIYSGVRAAEQGNIAGVISAALPGAGGAIGKTLGASGTAANMLGNAVLQGGQAAVTGGNVLESAAKGAAVSGIADLASGYIYPPAAAAAPTTPYGTNPMGTLSANEIAAIPSAEAFKTYQTAGMIPSSMTFNGGNILTSAGTPMIGVSSGGAGLNLPPVQAPENVTFTAPEPVAATPLPPGGMTSTGGVPMADNVTVGGGTTQPGNALPTTTPPTAPGGLLDLNNDGKVGVGDLVKGASGAMTIVGSVGGIADALKGGGSQPAAAQAPAPAAPYVLRDAAGNALGTAVSGITATNAAPIYGGPEQVYFLNNRATNVSRPILPAAATGGLLSLGGTAVTPPGYAEGGEVTSRGTGLMGLAPQLIQGAGDGMSDDVPAYIDGGEVREPIRVADGEYIVPADVVSHLGNGSTDAGSKALDALMAKVRSERTGSKKQAPKINPDKFLKAV